MTPDPATYIGKRGLLRIWQTPALAASAAIHVPVTVLDARRNYGRVDLLVSPVDGEGETWVQSERVKLANQDNGTVGVPGGVYDE